MKIGTKKYARVKVEGISEMVMIPVSTDKPSIPEDMQQRWQNIIDLVARTLGVPSGQITRFTEETLEIFVTNERSGNPFRTSDSSPLGTGMFCETVAGHREMMQVDDIRSSDYWRNNPFAKTGMLSYIGVPLAWEDGEMFGTFCLLDGKTNSYSDAFKQFILQFKEVIEADLRSVLQQRELQSRLSAQELMIREAHHRINNHFSLLIGYIQMQAAERETNRDLCEVLMDVKNRLRSISLIHDNLCKSNDPDPPPLDSYLSELCRHIIGNVAGTPIGFVCSIDPVKLRVEYLVAIGLIVAELVTNSVKYAFHGIAHPEIRLDVRKTGAATVVMNFRDNGVGLPEGLDLMTTSTLGLTLIRLQVEQLHGSILVENRNGVGYTISLDF